MLDSLRKNTKIIALITVIGLALPFAISAYLQKDSARSYAGVVFGKKVSYQEFDRFYQASQTFNTTDANRNNEDFLRQSTWQGIIFSHAAKKKGIQVSDAEVKEQLLKLLEHQNISPENYPAWVDRGLHRSPQQFEEQLREMIRIQKLMDTVAPEIQSIHVTPEEAKKEYLQSKNQIAFELLSFDSEKEASQLRSKLKKPEDWKAATAKDSANFNQTDLIPLEAVVPLLGVSATDGEKLIKLEKDQFSQPLARGKQYSVFYIKDRKKVDEKSFEAEKENFIKTLQEQRQRQMLVIESQKIIDEAKLQDFIPSKAS